MPGPAKGSKPRTTEELDALIPRAEAMFQDGCSQNEVCKTLGVSHGWITKHFRGRGWTKRMGGEFRAMVRWGTDMSSNAS
jgi:hypothetical protein